MACEKIEQCMLGVTCDQLGGFIDCATDEGICIGECVLDVDCAELPNLLQNNPCVTACQGGQGGAGGGETCQSCAQANCGPEVLACLQDNTCSDFLTCVQACDPADPTCFTDCAAANAGPETQALADCACNNCSGSCPCAGTGAGGAGMGGAGGT